MMPINVLSFSLETTWWVTKKMFSLGHYLIFGNKTKEEILLERIINLENENKELLNALKYDIENNIRKKIMDELMDKKKPIL